jgi:hypothetical protein
MADKKRTAETWRAVDMTEAREADGAAKGGPTDRLFAANAAFNNLDYAFLSTLFNWGRATLGTIPFVTLGAHYMGPEGVILGIVAGGAISGLAAILTAYGIARRIARTKPGRGRVATRRTQAYVVRPGGYAGLSCSAGKLVHGP